MTTTVDRGVVRHRLRIRGVVQGVGFRPFVHRLARELALGGLVGNDSDGVFAEVEGPQSAVEAFERRVVSDHPPLARVDSVEATPIAPVGERGYRIVESRSGSAPTTFVPPDVALCDDCRAELLDPRDRRYRYPFINCTNCGPRFTVTAALPYDRPNTTMRKFPLCRSCAAEYRDPTDRRYHAEPVACFACGPQVRFETSKAATAGLADASRAQSDRSIAAAQRLLGRGGIVAVKGVGGYHLACDATSAAAVAELRRRKGRVDKPFAVMVRDLAAAERLAFIDEAEAAALASPQRPIVLLRRRPGSGLAEGVAPHNPLVGVMLAYSPLHLLLFHPVPGLFAPTPEVLVMTSGNVSDEPICYDDLDARRRLGRLADAWLLHNRPIHVPCDDSVVRIIDGAEVPIRRSRGYTPLPVRLPFAVPPMIAAGGELKNTFCVAAGHQAWLSQHIGDMAGVEAVAAFERSVRNFCSFYGCSPELVAADAHPGYRTRQWAERCEQPLVEVQHHHAHIASAMAEHGLEPDSRVIGFAFDGTGYGSDGAIWGGEVLIGGYESVERVSHLRYVPLPGGDSTIRKPYRSALTHLWAAGIDWGRDLAPVRYTGESEQQLLRSLLDRRMQAVPTSSMGRLFDAVSSLLDIRHLATYEGQAAIELEALAQQHIADARRYRFGRRGDTFDAGPVLRAMVGDLRAGTPAGPIASGFHLALVSLIESLAEDFRTCTGLSTVVLSGGVFQNALLLRLTVAALRRRGFGVLTHRLVPPNDGGIALGQVVVAAQRIRRGTGVQPCA